MKQELYVKKRFEKFPEEVQKILADRSIPESEAGRLLNMQRSLVNYYRRKLAGKPLTAQEARRKYSRERRRKINVPRPRKEWTKEEDEFIMNSDLTDLEIGAILDRSIASIGHRRARLRIARNEPCEEISRLDEDLSLQNENPITVKTRTCQNFIKANYTSMTNKELAKALNLSERGLVYHITELKDELGGTGPNKPRKHKATEYLDYFKEHQNTMSYLEMAEDLGLTKSQVSYYTYRLRKSGKLPYVRKGYDDDDEIHTV